MTLLFFLGTSGIQSNVFDDVVSYLQSGNTQKVESYFSSKTEIELPDGTLISGKTEKLKDALQDFMQENSPKTVKIIHRGPDGNSSFVVASYAASNGKAFRVTIFMEGKGDQKQIRELKFENS